MGKSTREASSNSHSSTGSRARRDTAPSNVAASYSRYSTEQQDESSIAQQQKRCQERAAENGHSIPAEMEFFDEAVSGTVRYRKGLDSMLDAGAAGRFSTIYFDSLSRLARESVISLPILKQLVHRDKVRIVSVTEGIDSIRTDWELSAIIRCWMHAEFLKNLCDAIRRGQVYNIDQGFSIGDWCYGFTSEPIPNSERGRRGRHPKPRMRYIIVEHEAEVVRMIFVWFVHERRSLTWITKELNRRKISPDHRSTTSTWRTPSVRRLLRNLKYIGIWQWGTHVTCRDPLTGKKWYEEVSPEEAAKYTRERPHLQIVDRDIFCEAQGLLDENEAKCNEYRKPNGTFRGGMNGGSQPRHLLQQLLVCAECGKKFIIKNGGATMGCSSYKHGTCSCKTTIRRDLVESKLLKVIQERFLNCASVKEKILADVITRWQALQATTLPERTRLEKQLSNVNTAISRLIDEIEKQGADDDLRNRRLQRNEERAEIEQQLRALERAEKATVVPPTMDWIEERLQSIGEVLATRSTAAALLLRRILGTVRLTEVTKVGRISKMLRGTFTVDLSAAIFDAQGNDQLSEDRQEVSIDFAELAPWEARAEEIMQLIATGLSYERIGEIIGGNRSWVSRAKHYWKCLHALAS